MLSTLYSGHANQRMAMIGYRGRFNAANFRFTSHSKISNIQQAEPIISMIPGVISSSPAVSKHFATC
jgi:hypothetical protein